MELLLTIVACALVSLAIAGWSHVAKIIATDSTWMEFASPWTIAEHLLAAYLIKRYQRLLSAAEASIRLHGRPPCPETYVLFGRYESMIERVLKSLGDCTKLCKFKRAHFCPGTEEAACKKRFHSILSRAAKLDMDSKRWEPEDICPVCLEAVTFPRLVPFSIRTASVTCNNVFCRSCAPNLEICPISRLPFDVLVSLHD
jgi:hypothetical protein